MVQALSASSSPASQFLEAELGKLSGLASVSKAVSGYSGTGYVSGFQSTNDTVAWTFTSQPGIYQMRIRFRSPFGPKGYAGALNRRGFSGTFDSTTTFASVDAGLVVLLAGTNTLQIGGGWNWYEIDRVDFVPSTLPPLLPVATQLADPLATSAARTLWSSLVADYGRATWAGQHDAVNLTRLQSATGRKPVVVEGDLIDYSPSRVERQGQPAHYTEDYLDLGSAGHVVGFCWHWNAPTNLLNTTAQPWSGGFYTEATTFDLAAALANTNSAHYALLLRDIDAIAVQLRKLADRGIPVLWRPLHESEGGWFWWGAKGPTAFKALWRLLYSRLTIAHGLHNLIWVLTSSAPDWYPGHDVVDIVGLDAYPADTSDSLSSYWQSLKDRFDGVKLLALTEFGGMPDIDYMRSVGVHWSYFSPWTGSYIESVSPAALARVYGSTAVITLDELNSRPTQVAQSPGLVGWWRAEGNASDAAGNNMGMLNGGVAFSSGEVGQAFHFDGMTGTVAISDAPALNPAGSFTIEAWINPDIALSQQANWPRIVDKCFLGSSAASARRGWMLYVNGSESGNPGTIGFEINDGTLAGTVGPTVQTTSASLTPAGRWSHLAGIYNHESCTIALYLNGELQGQAPAPQGPAVSDKPLHLGSGGNWDYFHGLIDEVSFYSRALTAQEVAGIFRAGSAGKSTVVAAAPVLLSNPENQGAMVGDTVKLRAVVQGAPPLRYQWRWNGNPLSNTAPYGGAQSDTLVISGVQLSHAGFYSLAVSNSAGSIVTAPAEVRVTGHPPGRTNLVLNPGFELGTQSWQSYGNAAIAVPSGLASNWVHSGFNAVQVTHRINAYDGVGQSLLGRITPNTPYGLSAWVRLEQGGSQPVLLTVYEREQNGTQRWIGVARATADSSQWVQLLGTYTLSSTNALSDLTLYMEGPAAGVSFYADDFLMEPKDTFDWKPMANADIDQYRKRDARLQLVDDSGQPVANATLKVRQTRSSFAFGSAITPSYTNAAYAAFFRTNFEWAVMENESKWPANQPQAGVTNYTVADGIANFCRSNGITLRGHCLFWGVTNFIQPWVKALSDADLRIALTNRLVSAVNHFKGTFAHWDVNNEMLHGNYYGDRLGAWVNPWMFAKARELDPAVRLFVNEYENIEGGRTQEYKDQIRRLLAAGVPVDAIGVQGHFGATVNPWLLGSSLDSLAELGLPIWITEYDSDQPDPVARANNIETLYRIAFSKPAVKGIMMWGFWAGAHWRSNAPIVNLNWSLNEAGRRYQALRAEWTTVITNVTDAQGFVAFRGFHGEYDIEATGADLPLMKYHFTLEPGAGTYAVALTAAPPSPTPTNVIYGPTTFVAIDPARTYLLTTNDVSWTATENQVFAGNSLPLRLADYGIVAGSYVRLQRTGRFAYMYYSNPTNVESTMVGVFSASPALLPETNLRRVPGAVATETGVATLSTYYGNHSTDIAEDFEILEETITRVPTGAAYLFVCPNDGLFSDNVSTDQSYGLRLSPVRLKILNQPQSQSTAAGSNATFTVTATGTAPLAHQWRRGTAPISGATASSYTLNNVQLSDSGSQFSVVVTNAYGAITSSVAVLTVTPTNSAPANLVAWLTFDDPAHLNADSSGKGNHASMVGLPTAVNGKLSGAASLNGASYLLWEGSNSPVVKALDGSFSVSVWLKTTQSYASGSSYPWEGAGIVGADYPGNPPTGTGDAIPLALTGSKAAAFAGGSGFLHSTSSINSGQWTHLAFVRYAHATAGYTRLYVNGQLEATGLSDTGVLSAAGHLILGAQDTNWQQLVGSLDDFRLYNTTLSDAEIAALYSPSPVIRVQPAGVTRPVGGTASFSVAASGAQPLSYQWRFGNTMLTNVGRFSGAASTNLSISNLQLADAGNYTVVVTNAYGAITSQVAVLTIKADPPVDHVTFGDFAEVSGLQLNGSTKATNTSDGYVLQLTPAKADQAGSAFSKVPISLSSNASFSTYFRFRLSEGGGFIPDVDEVSGADGIAFVVQTIANNVGTNGGGLGYLGITNSVGIEFDTWYNSGFPTSDPIAGGKGDGNHIAIDLNGDPTSVAAAHVSQTLNNGQVWHAWIDYNGVTHTLEVRLSQDSARPEFASLTYTVDLLNYLRTPTAYVGFTGATGWAYNQQDILSWQFSTSYRPIGITLTGQPQNQTVAIGETAAFSVAAASTAPLTYQWLLGTTHLINSPWISGVSSNILTLSNVQLSEAGSYRVIVSNPSGAVTSQVAVLTVHVPAQKPVITMQPLSQTNALGASASFSVTATGTAPLTFQWCKNSVPMTNATDQTLTLDNVQMTDVGDYTVVVSNIAGHDTSLPAHLTVINPIIPAHPADQNADFQMVIGEVTAYGSAWKRSQSWPVAPNPIPISYVTRAGLLWKKGERYGYDATGGDPPLCWVSLGTPSASVGRLSVLSSSTSTAASSIQGTLVTLSAMPAALVSAYAVEDGLPEGFAATNVSGGGVYDTATRHVKWGPFFDAQARVFSYTVVMPPGFSGTTELSGIASFDGVDTAIRGERALRWESQPTEQSIERALSVFGSTIDVTVSAHPLAGVAAYAVEETVPAGFSITNMNEAGTYDTGTRKLKWGPFFDDQARTLNYQLLAPSGFSGTATLSGIGSFDGVDVVVGGPNQFEVSSAPAEADLQPVRFNGLLIDGPVGQTYTIEYSTSLTPPVHWQALETIRLTNASQRWADLESVGQPIRFYRAISVPSAIP